LLTYTAAPDSTSEESLRFLGSWAMSHDQVAPDPAVERQQA
jgi:hypothetical protein